MALSIEDDIPLFNSVDQIAERLHLRAQLDIPDESLGSIVAKYELPPEKMHWTKCGWNGCGEPHRFGFVISDKQGRETTCGQDCAERKGGVEFKEVIARLKVREETLARQRVVADLLKERTTSEAAVREATRAVNLAAGHFDTFKTHFRPIWRVLEDAATSQP